jgi:hypothetical protein
VIDSLLALKLECRGMCQSLQYQYSVMAAANSKFTLTVVRIRVPNKWTWGQQSGLCRTTSWHGAGGFQTMIIHLIRHNLLPLVSMLDTFFFILRSGSRRAPKTESATLAFWFLLLVLGGGCC